MGCGKGNLVPDKKQADDDEIELPGWVLIAAVGFIALFLIILKILRGMT